MAISPNNELYVAYLDGNDRINVMKFINNSWKIVGYKDVSHGMARDLNIAIAPDGTPYIAFGDYNVGFFYASVMKFNGLTWEYVGQEGFSNGEADNVKLAFNSKGLLYVAYRDYTNQSSVIVKQFNLLVWTTVGNNNISDGYVNDLSLTVNKNDIPYVAYITSLSFPFQAKVKMFNGCEWESLGVTNFTTKSASGIDLKISNDGTSYVVFYTSDLNLFVSRYTNHEWTESNTGFLTFNDQPIRLMFHDNIPYIVFRDFSYQYKLTVINFINNQWNIVGNQGFTAIYADRFDLAISPSGAPYVVYDDYNNFNYVSVMGYL